jgi:peroxiredoxin Q/BCP
MTASLDPGQHLPTFSIPDQDGNPVTHEDLLGRGPFVVYFYPRDDTPGCTVEACAFRDDFEAFTDAGAAVYGVSADSPEKHREFRARHNLPFTLLSDSDGSLSKAFGVKRALGLLPGRVTWVFDADGVVQHRFSSQLQPRRHVAEALDVVRRLS